jgi:7,8-dihydro-6-hydroxymethylpterin-pyrophosphokinase
VLLGEIRAGRRYRLELDEASEPLNCVEMDTHLPPKEQAARLAHYDARANRLRQRGAQHRAVADLDDAVIRSF